jgi:hypothetical protein
MMRRALGISLLLVVSACVGDEAKPIAAAPAEEIVIGPFPGGPCGSNTCGAGTFCCNSSCGVCAPIGGACLDVYCEPTQEAIMSPDERDEMSFVIGGGGQQCGYVTCGKGQHCCNASCSQCVPFGMECTQQSCD